MELLIMFLRAAVVWGVIALMAVANGLLRERVVAPALGDRRALQVSGVTLALLVLAAAWGFADFMGVHQAGPSLAVGVQWLIMTLVFEAGLGRWVMKRRWKDLLQIFDVTKGDLFLLVLLVTLLAPYVVGKVRGDF